MISNDSHSSSITQRLYKTDFRLRISDATTATACINKGQLNHVKHAIFDLLTRMNRISIFKGYYLIQTLKIGNTSTTLSGHSAQINYAGYNVA